MELKDREVMRHKGQGTERPMGIKIESMRSIVDHGHGC